jgi:fumarate hydratase subunit beta
MKKVFEIYTPLDKKQIVSLKTGMMINLNGEIYTARDQAHKRLIENIKKGKRLPIDLKNSIIYYCGPTPAKKGKVIGACGPTTSYRMDKYMIFLLQAGLGTTIGKGERAGDIRKLIKKYKAIYFVTWAGCGAYLSQFVKAKKLIAFPELGSEAIYKLEVRDFPLIVAIDSSGRDIYEMRRKK